MASTALNSNKLSAAQSWEIHELLSKDRLKRLSLAIVAAPYGARRLNEDTGCQNHLSQNGNGTPEDP